MNKTEVLELRDSIFKEWEADAISASSGMPSGPSKESEWFQKLTELADTIDDKEHAAHVCGFADSQAAWAAMMHS